ncbi:hypothetical protein R6Q59_001570 [Mikania micrantha]
MLCLSKLANASVTLDSLRCSTELVGSTSTESRKKKAPESAQGKIRKQENCTNLPPVTLSGLRRRRKKVRVQFLMKRSYSHSMDMLAFGMKMDEQALEPGTDEIRGKHGTDNYTGGRDMTAT